MANDRVYGITGFGAYIPRLRMERAAIAAAHKWMAPSLRAQGKGQRAFCSWDEDSITMAVEASRDVLKGGKGGIESVVLASTTFPYADLQNSTVVASLLGLPESNLRTQDVGGSQRAGVSALVSAIKAGDAPALVIASDRPRGKPASTQEIGVGAGAAAFTLGSENVIVELLASAASSVNFPDHFRSSDSKYDYFWEERWIRDEGYGKIAAQAGKAALAKAGVAGSDIKHIILPSPFKAVATAVAKKLGIAPEAEVDALTENCGYSGAAHGLLMLALTLEKAAPGDLILLIGFGQGCEAVVLRATDAIKSFAPRRGVSGALADGQVHADYMRLLSYEDSVELEWGMRSEKQLKTALTEQFRSRDQLASFNAGKCTCGTIQFPQLPYCVNPACNAPRKNFEQVSLVDVPAQVLTFTADWLSYHPAPPLYVGFAQFDNGARLLMEFTDVGAAGVDVGTPMKMVCRIKDKDKARDYSRYFWKATPVQA